MHYHLYHSKCLTIFILILPQFLNFIYLNLYHQVGSMPSSLILFAFYISFYFSFLQLFYLSFINFMACLNLNSFIHPL